ncbi:MULTISPECIES: hypothetical protein [Mesorhizobium]|uniref:hypothetical protein n=1 Tax=Mesorhizobium TaxID=68287 RepID=UPI0004164052|nr:MULTISPECIES: hypothetical protein [Mesorhizobium]WJI36449.1 hypothetical protein NL534_21415 [Mesorhizobium opportunistum]
MTMDTLLLVAGVWVGGGALFIHGIVTNPNASQGTAANSRAVIGDLLRLRPAALVAAVMFLGVWPAIWVGANLVRR